ncbi:hypothetical protein B0H17DRAFT_1037644 [Mycena rosella]|uniref:Uncharacterized protein n=1 Tax=Mycena rosella TaxID=1033263 RepID=A0AAD7GU10_MYCRO|nr:hypothetical protein B0H17DRAFT_1037644 [Mycena rosella]
MSAMCNVYHSSILIPSILIVFLSGSGLHWQTSHKFFAYVTYYNSGKQEDSWTQRTVQNSPPSNCTHRLGRRILSIHFQSKLRSALSSKILLSSFLAFCLARSFRPGRCCRLRLD